MKTRTGQEKQQKKRSQEGQEDEEEEDAKKKRRRRRIRNKNATKEEIRKDNLTFLWFYRGCPGSERKWRRKR
jgi:hypothetical protein